MCFCTSILSIIIVAALWVSDAELEFVVPRTTVKRERISESGKVVAERILFTNETDFVHVNYDESKAGVIGRDYTIPDPLTFTDGRKVASAADWAERRKEILGIFEREVYGRMPPKPDAMSYELVSEKMTEDRFAMERRYRQWFSADKTGPCIDWVMFVPRYAKKPCPAILHLNYKGNDLTASGRTNHFLLPLGEFTARGYAFMSAHYTQITSDGPDRGGEPFSGVFELWGNRDHARTDNTGSIMAWAWGLCRGLDLAEKVDEIDACRSVVVGSSRLGKAALLAAAFDERFKVCVANQTGAIGVQLMKRDFGENIATQRRMFPWWYCSGVWKWMGREKEMSFDQHMLLACVAPRALLVEGFDSPWFDPRGEWFSVKAASPVWEFLTGYGIGLDDWPYPYDGTAAHPPLGYARRTEEHGLSPYDWRWALDFADKALRNAATETSRWQSAIDAVARKGGGVVFIPAGRHLVGQLDLKDNVELHIEKGAVLEGAVGMRHYRVTELPYSEGTWSAVVSAVGITNVAITGKGEIFGNGTAWPQPDNYGGNQEGRRPRGVFFADCRDIRLSDFTLRDAACWGIVCKRCEDVDIRRVKVDSHANANNDGMDIEARNVVIADCDIDSGDDGVCLKSNDPGFVVENVLVTNVISRSHCNALKIGTATHGTVRNVLFVDCRTDAPRRDFVDRRPGKNNRNWYENDQLAAMSPGSRSSEPSGWSAIAVMNVDGGIVEDVTYRNIVANGSKTPIFVRGGRRLNRPCGTPPSDKRIFRSIVIENVTGTALSSVPSSVTGVDGCRVVNCTLRNVRLKCRGLGMAESEKWLAKPVPENPGGYPEAHVFKHALTAWGLYVRHVDGLKLENCGFELLDGTADSRKQIVFDDVR